MVTRMRNLFASARRNMNLGPDCPKYEQGSDHRYPEVTLGSVSN